MAEVLLNPRVCLKTLERTNLPNYFTLNAIRLKIRHIFQDQLLRASSSIALNVSEATGRRTPADQRRFFGIAYGSLQECRTILELERANKPEIEKVADELAAILYTLSRRKLAKQTRSL